MGLVFSALLISTGRRLSRLLAITPFPGEAQLLGVRFQIPDTDPYLRPPHQYTLKLGQDTGYWPCPPCALA